MGGSADVLALTIVVLSGATMVVGVVRQFAAVPRRKRVN